MIYLPDTNSCIALLRQKQPRLIARWQSTKVTDVMLCSIVVYELRHGAESSSDPRREHAKFDVFLAPFSSLPLDDVDAVKCAEREVRAVTVYAGSQASTLGDSDERHRAPCSIEDARCRR